jgi:hypothetical protein
MVEWSGVALVRLELGRIFLEELVVAELGLGRMASGVEQRIVARQHKLVEQKDFAEVVVGLVALVSGRELVEEHRLVVVVEQLVFVE